MSTLSAIVAMANNRAIGKDNQLLWHLPEDLKYFKRITMGKPIIMGRKTFESIGRPLPGRLNIVVTRQSTWSHKNVKVANTIDAAIRLASSQAFIDGIDEVIFIGGAELYKAVLPNVDKLYLTRVNTEIEGDAFFPEIDDQQWQEIHREAFSASDNNTYDYAFCILTRR